MTSITVGPRLAGRDHKNLRRCAYNCCGADRTRQTTRNAKRAERNAWKVTIKKEQT